jgi:hypothetical protein
MNENPTPTTGDGRTTWCPDHRRYDRGECGWPRCRCPDNGPTDDDKGVVKPGTEMTMTNDVFWLSPEGIKRV